MKSGVVLLHGNPPPYGYRLSDDGKTLVVYEPEARIVRLIFTWYVEGDENGKKLSVGAIVRRLTEMDILTWRDTHKWGFKKRGFGQWTRGTIKIILNNETYIGLWHYGRCGKRNKLNPRSQWLTVEVPAIISRELWEKAQAQKERNKEMSRRNTKHNYLMGRRVTCGWCSHKMHGNSRRYGKHIHSYYRCTAKEGKIIGQECDIPNFKANHVDAAVWSWVKSFLSDPVALQDGLNAYQAEREQENAPLQERLKVVEDLLTDNRAQLKRLLDWKRKR